ncbi:hypothetical protein [Streptomyces gilvosporeus]|uniref:Uncharacterized protein n=1 Tax=Streptomyces gilvosporeus TaxID=553510 RepID=A0A1V0TKG3_9ACTN|nr:hypothetical protein [Streptomyces gilvosporeus]ARF53288.1 hypothetical protein B1H19_03115 [Streptomyces gilvosporeus]
MTKITQMSDNERNRLIYEFWEEMSEELDLSLDFTAGMQSMRPHLPDTPSSAQVEAWIELAEMIQDGSLRRALRNSRKDREARKRMVRDPSLQRALSEEALQACEAGEDPASRRGRALTDAYTSDCLVPADVAAMSGRADTPEVRRQLADQLWEGSRIDHYMNLLRMINGKDPHPHINRHLAMLEWLAEALRASAQ